MRFISSSHDLNADSIEQAKKSVTTFRQRKDIGFPDILNRNYLWEDIKNLATEKRKLFPTCAVIGIGGSAVGPQVLASTLGNAIDKSHSHSNSLVFFDNVDEVDFHQTWSKLNMDQTLWFVVSKSGNTIETLMTFERVSQLYRQHGKDISKQVVIASEKRQNPLFDWAQSKKCYCLEIPQDVGGRFSVLTAVGMFPGAFLGLDIDAIKKGAAAALDANDLIVRLVAQTINSWKREEWITMFWFYSSQLKGFGSWLNQLWAESLAKKIDRQGRTGARVSTPIFATGACDQHSLLQQVMEGEQDKFVIFLRNYEAEAQGRSLLLDKCEFTTTFKGKSLGDVLAAEAKGTEQALREAGVSTLSLGIEKVDEFNLGFQFMFWQLVVASLGEALDINAFDQPGVEAGKIIARSLLK